MPEKLLLRKSRRDERDQYVDNAVEQGNVFVVTHYVVIKTVREDIGEETDQNAWQKPARDRRRDGAYAVEIERELEKLGYIRKKKVEQYACNNKARGLQVFMLFF